MSKGNRLSPLCGLKRFLHSFVGRKDGWGGGGSGSGSGSGGGGGGGSGSDGLKPALLRFKSRFFSQLQRRDQENGHSTLPSHPNRLLD